MRNWCFSVITIYVLFLAFFSFANAAPPNICPTILSKNSNASKMIQQYLDFLKKLKEMDIRSENLFQMERILKLSKGSLVTYSPSVSLATRESVVGIETVLSTYKIATLNDIHSAKFRNQLNQHQDRFNQLWNTIYRPNLLLRALSDLGIICKQLKFKSERGLDELNHIVRQQLESKTPASASLLRQIETLFALLTEKFPRAFENFRINLQTTFRQSDRVAARKIAQDEARRLFGNPTREVINRLASQYERIIQEHRAQNVFFLGSMTNPQYLERLAHIAVELLRHYQNDSLD